MSPWVFLELEVIGISYTAIAGFSSPYICLRARRREHLRSLSKQDLVRSQIKNSITQRVLVYTTTQPILSPPEQSQAHPLVKSPRPSPSYPPPQSFP
jgi:hypothetical protein